MQDWFAQPHVFVGLALVLGLLVGSFLNVVIHRLPIMLTQEWDRQAQLQLGLPEKAETGQRYGLLFPPSQCPKCAHPIKPWRNIPILSFLLLRGRCPHCENPISWRYPLVEALTGVAFALVAWHFGFGWAALGAMILTAFLVAMIFIDAQTQLLPDQLTLPLLWLGLLFNLAHIYTDLPNAVLGAAVGYMALWTLFQVFKLITGKEGMGFGDFKLLAALGAWLGVASLPIIVLMSSLVGLIFALLLRVSKGQAMPFGPYLAISGWLVLMFQQPIMQGVNWWLTKSGF